MKFFYIFFVFNIIVSCSTCKKEIDKALLDDIKTDMASFNKNLKGYLYRYKLNGDLSSLDKSLYLEMLKEKVKTSQNEYLEFVRNVSSELILKSSNADFVICIKSIENKIILCDKASTGILDFVSYDMNLDIFEEVLVISKK